MDLLIYHQVSPLLLIFIRLFPWQIVFSLFSVSLYSLKPDHFCRFSQLLNQMQDEPQEIQLKAKSYSRALHKRQKWQLEQQQLHHVDLPSTKMISNFVEEENQNNEKNLLPTTLSEPLDNQCRFIQK